jgi:hypothetical protein
MGLISGLFYTVGVNVSNGQGPIRVVDPVNWRDYS